MTESHAMDPAGELSAADRALLAGDVPDPHPEPPAPEPVDWEARVLELAARSRPHREAQRAARERRDRILAAQRAARRRDANRERASAQVPLRYRDAAPDHPAVAAWVRECVAGHRDSLVLNGPIGTGKTWQAFGAFAAVAQRTGCSTAAVAVPALLDSLRPGRAPLAELSDLERVDLLLLDDLAAERESEWTREVVYRLIDARWNAVLPTIITLNAPGTALRDRLGDRVASRLNGMGRVVIIDGPDRRLPPRT